MEIPMIKLNEQQLQAIQESGTGSPRLVNPLTNETFVLVRLDEYERLKGEDYDDSPWTREELDALAWDAGRHEDWDEYNDVEAGPGQP